MGSETLDPESYFKTNKGALKMARKEKGPKLSRTYRLPADVVNFLETRPNATSYLASLVRRELANETGVYIIDMRHFAKSSRDMILKKLDAEGVAIQEVSKMLSDGFAVFPKN